MKKYLSQRLCPLCGDRHGWLIRPLRYALFDDLGFSGNSPLISCSSCGFVFNDLSEGSSVLAAYYSGHDHYLVSTTAGSGGSTPAERTRYDRLLQRLDEWLEPTQTILDVGCGKAGFLLHLRECGYSSLLGLEASTACRNVVANETGLSVVERIEQLPKTPSVVVISHVLEHLYDPLGFLRELVLSSTSDAVFYLEMPNSSSLPDAEVPWSWLYFEHINHFDRPHLLAMARLAGLSPIMDGTWSFQPGEGNKTDCLYVLCRKGTSRVDEIRDIQLAVCLDNSLSDQPMPETKIKLILSSRHDLVLWGLSQYAMLILGMHPEITDRLEGILDASPAKIGRRIQNIVVQNSMNISNVRQKLILLPKSNYTENMINQLASLNYKSQYLII
ncbi:MAG TPA: class I SAM-dependent methyltransferase [Candidatus Competibacter sp.]|nr:class I SAM-dependent methyltransferase [Candidatus Competibacter sp.]